MGDLTASRRASGRPITVTIRDVAEAAGVSTATVSRVLSGNRSRADDYAAAVYKAVDQLGYRGDAVARALRRGATQVVGIVVPDITNPFFPRIVQAIERSLHDTANGLLLGDSSNDPELEADRISTLLDRRVDGLVIVPCDAERSAEAVADARRRVPVLQLDRRVEGVRTDYVGVDDAAGIAATTEHVIAGGRRRPAFVGARRRISSGRRREAFRATTARLLGEPAEQILEGDFSVAWGEAAAAELLAGKGGDRPDAIVCGNDLIALGVLRTLRLAGMRVPADVAVTGFDDVGFASISDPAITTARQPLDALGGEGARLLLRRIAGETGPPIGITLAPELVVRESTDAPPDRRSTTGIAAEARPNPHEEDQ
jgi:LacI family transcriptional regulator